MHINPTLVGLADARRLIAAIQACGVTAPKPLSEVLQAHERLSQAPPVADPTRSLVKVALQGNATPETISAQLESTAIARLVVAERQGLLQRCEPALLDEFCRRLDNGGADAVLDALRAPFDKAATSIREALEVIAMLPSSADEFMASATGKQLAAWQSLPPAIAVLDRVAAVAARSGRGASSRQCQIRPPKTLGCNSVGCMTPP